MSTSLVPEVGTTGLFTLAAPFNTLLAVNTAYTCIAVKQIADIVSNGDDPYEKYYAPYSLDKTTYQNDLAAGMVIVSLQASSGSVQSVPSTYISALPNIGGVPYSVMMLGVELSAIPESLDLTYLVNQIEQLVKDTIGVTSTVHQVKVSATTNLSATDAATIEAARQANITNSTTTLAQLLAAQTTIASQQQMITMLENYIKTHVAPGAT